MLTSNIYADDDARSGAMRSGVARGGMRGLGSCCTDCAASGTSCGGLGDASAAPAPGTVHPWFLVLALGIGAVASGLVIYDRFKKDKRRRRRVRRATDAEGHSTRQIPIDERMADVVFERRK